MNLTLEPTADPETDSGSEETGEQPPQEEVPKVLGNTCRASDILTVDNIVSAGITCNNFAQIEEHTVIGYDILEKKRTLFLMAEGARLHYERWDGISGRTLFRRITQSIFRWRHVI